MPSESMGEKSELRALVASLREFQKISKPYFYTDLFFTAAVAWVSLYFLSLSAGGGESVVLVLLAYLAFYRASAFIHEVSHFGRKIRGLEWSYNLLIGFPNRAPLYIHEPHKYHHLPHTFGTARDPEYLYLRGRGSAYFFRPFFAAPLAPMVLALRFGVLPIFSWAFPRRWQNKIYRRISTLVVNPAYVREEGRAVDIARAQHQDFGCVIFFLVFLAAGITGVLPLAFFAWWYALAVVATFVNMYRARVAHRYDNPGKSLSPLGALRDSVTIEGGVLSELWAPLGLKYHSLHHLAPQIPYHNLGRAHRYLRTRLAPEHSYKQTVLPTFASGLRQYGRTLRV